MIRFRTWFENEVTTARQDAAPASAEVMRTGLQPQVDAQETQTSSREESDMLQAVDAHVQRMVSATSGIHNDSDKMSQIKRFVVQTAAKWQKLKKDTGKTPEKDLDGLAGINPSPEELAFMKDNQPLPSSPLGNSGMANY